MLRIGTLRLTQPFGGALATAAIFLALAVTGVEALARTPAVQSRLLLPVLAGHYDLGPKEALASRLLDADGRIDCFFIGNSPMGKGVVPREFEQAYRRLSGQSINCFNFALDGLTLSGGQALIRILAGRYHPRLIVYGIHYTSFTTSTANGYPLDSPWARYELGALDFEGWLEASLMSYRYALTYGQPAADLAQSRLETRLLDRDGYKLGASVEVQRQPPGRKKDRWFYEELATFDVQGHRGPLDELLRASTPGLPFVLVDMPIPRTTVKAFSLGGYNYEDYLDAIYEEAAVNNVPFIPAIPPNLIPEAGYQDPLHLNDAGAATFSTWLGAKIGEAVKQGQIVSPGR
jgi:hypothetical protein